MAYVHDSAVLIPATEGVGILDLANELEEEQSPYAPVVRFIAQQISTGDKRAYGRGVAPVESLELSLRYRSLTPQPASPA
ncbi:hypothetical protein K2D_16570 [Planctomycetes bacterium K2D]|nr:hypothetical protein K2D_16570 [Planctomycetes bacterium K2D]